jgi:hypothetical protein
MQAGLRVSAGAPQQAVSLFFVANAVMCLVHGILIVPWGRRRMALAARDLADRAPTAVSSRCGGMPIPPGLAGRTCCSPYDRAWPQLVRHALVGCGGAGFYQAVGRTCADGCLPGV